MKKAVTIAVRWITGISLLILSVPSLRTPGLLRTLAVVEVAASVAFCVPQIWRIGGGALLAVLGIAFTRHALVGQFASSTLFAAFVVTLELFYGKP